MRRTDEPPRCRNPLAADPRHRPIERLIEHELDGLLAYFLRRVAVAEDAADLLSETLLVLWRRSADVPTDQTQARMWLFGVARRTLTTYRRGTGRRDALVGRLRAELAVSDVVVRSQPPVRRRPG